VVIAPHLRALLDIEGGFTVDPATGRRADAGIAVCVDPHPSAMFGHRDWTDGRVARWLVDVAPHLSRPGHYAGGGWSRPRAASASTS